MGSDSIEQAGLINRSMNDKIGILPPGPISNDDLFIPPLQDSPKDKPLQLRPYLQMQVHYRAVNKNVWQIFHRMYGGGPLIIRRDLDIYSRDAAKELSNKEKKSSISNHGTIGNIGYGVKNS